jgi:hypothetical protein
VVTSRDLIADAVAFLERHADQLDRWANENRNRSTNQGAAIAAAAITCHLEAAKLKRAL